MDTPIFDNLATESAGDYDIHALLGREKWSLEDAKRRLFRKVKSTKQLEKRSQK